LSKSIKTLVQDIYSLFNGSHKFNEDHLQTFANNLAYHITTRISNKKSKPELRMSNLGTPCDRKLWYSINTPEDQEELPPQVRFKFLYGDIIEELVLFLAAESGHTVTGTQDTLTINGVVGHRDAVIDGVLVDVKSASSYSFTKFKDHLTKEEDSFGYLDQLGAYLYASQEDPLVTNKNIAAFVAVDKTLGHIVVDIQPKTSKDYDKLVTLKREMLKSTTPPPRAFTDEEDGKSGNRKLCTECSYCPFKTKCWPGTRTYLYSTGPRYLTVVKNEPKVQELT
jgi:hypothetical protein